MSLSAREINTALRAAKAQGKPKKKHDERGLFLFAKPNGKASWHLKFMLNGSEKLISLGQLPDVTLKMARERRDEERRKIEEGVNPVDARRAERSANHIAQANTVENLAEEWLKMKRAKAEKLLKAESENAQVQAREHKSPGLGTLKRHQGRLKRFVYPFIGSKPIDQITSLELRGVFKKIEDKSKYDTAKRVCELCSEIWLYAVDEGKAQADIAHPLKRKIERMPQVSHAAITDPIKLGGLLRAIDGYEGSPLTSAALKLLAMVWTRPGELRRMEWSELNLNTATWTIPSQKMKMRGILIVPLSKQAVEILRGLKVHSGEGKFVFPSLQTQDRPMSENTINGGLRRLGYTHNEHVGHGFRSTASTLLYGERFNPDGTKLKRYNSDVIEAQLAHVKGGVKGVYDRNKHLEERREMMSDWSNYLDALKTQKVS
jgi:integrase